MGMQKTGGFREVRDDKHQTQREDSVQAATSRVCDLPDVPAVVHRLKAYRWATGLYIGKLFCQSKNVPISTFLKHN